ncbi:hypothetical protein AB0C12_43420 [Actinoplanes sp. NPDC048967]|uniref:hypothetical protein n=1 Tax=Actinoplanes sp. NPDC048967 TaxID=3155269 RepID=UPI00340FF079
MRRIVVYGFTGAGKSTPAARIGQRMRAGPADPAMPPAVLLRSPAEVERWPAGLR